MEFKSTGRRNLHTGDRDEKIEWAVIRAITAFMNSHGGTVLVGVNDNGEVLGIEADYPLLKKQDKDGWSLWLTDLAASALGKAAAAEIDLSIVDLENGSVARVEVGPAASPVFATPGNGKNPAFYVRLSNATHELAGQEALDYQKKRWPN